MIVNATAAHASALRAIRGGPIDADVWWHLTLGAALPAALTPPWLVGWNVPRGTDPHRRSRRRVLAATADFATVALRAQRDLTALELDVRAGRADGAALAAARAAV